MEKKKKITLKWSKKEKDWQINYDNNAGCVIGGSFFDMIRKFEEFMSKDFEGKPTEFTNLRDYLSEGGYDPDTFTIIVKQK